MIIIREVKTNKQISYEIQDISSEGKVISLRKIDIKKFIRKRGGQDLFLLLNNSSETIKTAYFFLNDYMALSPLTTRKVAATALKLFYIYCEIYKIDEKKLSFDDINVFKSFLAGVVHHEGHLTSRDSKTINIYLTILRQFFKFQGIQCIALESSITNPFKTENQKSDLNREVQRKKYDSSIPLEANKTAPKFISPDEFVRLYKRAEIVEDLTAVTLMTLMYQNGLRLGETLGLTIEDIDLVVSDFTTVPVVYLRNRLSDKPDQYCKNLFHPRNQTDYKQNYYQQSKVRIFIDENIYLLLKKLIEKTHEKAKEKYPQNYQKTIADKVTKKIDIKENHYIFLNKYGNRLSAQTWNKKLKQYFLECGLDIDREKKAINLSHRFRHGFAMFQAHFRKQPVSALTLQQLMRHKSIASTLVYYNPTEEMILKEKNNFYNEIDELIGKLNETSID